MKKNYIKLAIFSTALILGLSACTDKLNLTPTNDITDDKVYTSLSGYKSAFAKVYGSIALTGNNGPGTSQISGFDPGSTDFLRLFWKMQELPTEEAVVGWGDPGLPDFHKMTWSETNPFIFAAYYRSYYQIAIANDFIRQSSDEKLSSRGISGADANEIRKFRAEARFLRAFQYWVLMDLFGRPAFITDADPMGSTLPKQISRSDLFKYIEDELKAIEPILSNPKANEYGRADKAAAWALLARMYLNAQVYTGTAKYTDAITYSKKVIDAGYSLLPDYTKLMRADNHLGNTEAIFTINYDGKKSQNWGGLTFITHAAVGGDLMKASDFGIGGGWWGLRTTKNLPALFTDVNDKRAQFFKDGQNLEINEIGTFTDGYAVTKYKNIKSDGTLDWTGRDNDFVDIDFPVFRLAEMYLIYAESVIRGGNGGSLATALTYVNNLRTRAQAAPVSQSNLTEAFILDERGRELYWEGHRRTDLIRYNKFTSNDYLWPWKGGEKNGKGVDSWRNIYPIPADDLVANPNLTQNPNY